MSVRSMTSIPSVLVGGAVSLLLPVLAAAQPAPQSPAPVSEPAADDAAPIVARAAELVMVEGPSALPAGATFAILQGDPAAAAPLTLRLTFPAGYRVPPHYHAGIEHVTVLSGKLHVAMGEPDREEEEITLVAGDFAAIPAGMVHWAWTGEEPVRLQVHATGPWSLTYVDPTHDPRNPLIRE